MSPSDNQLTPEDIREHNERIFEQLNDPAVEKLAGEAIVEYLRAEIADGSARRRAARTAPILPFEGPIKEID